MASADTFLPSERAIDDMTPDPLADEVVEALAESANGKKGEVIKEITAETVKNIGLFSAAIIKDLEDLRGRCVQLRDNRNFSKRMTINNRRGAAEVKVSFDADGVVKRTVEDGHAEVGINQGWSFQAIETADAYLYQTLFESHPRPYRLKWNGGGSEGRRLEQVFTAAVDELLRKGNLRQEGKKWTRRIGQHGTVAWRYEAARRPVFRRGMDGQWKEDIGRFMPVIRTWPLQNVLVTDFDKEDATDQEGVFWITPDATLQTVLADEAVFDAEDNLRAGKFVNLEAVRKMYGEPRIDSSQTSYHNRATETVARPMPIFTLVEFEGWMPLSKHVKLGYLTPDVAKFFSIKVGMNPKPDDDAEMEEWTRRMEAITHFRYSYAVQSTGDDGAGMGSGILLQAEPDRNKEPRNSLFSWRYVSEIDEWYGMSIVDLGRRLEDSGDMITNAQVWAIYKNAHPSGLISGQAVRQVADRKKAITDLVTQPDTWLEVSGQPKLSDLLETFKHEFDPASQAVKRDLHTEFQFTTLVSASAIGAPSDTGTNTLGELQIDETKSRIQLNSIALAGASELCRMVRLIIQDMIYYMTPEELAAFLIRTAGLSAKGINELLPSLDGIENEFEIRHPMTVAADKTVLVTLLMRLFQLVGVMGFPDVKKFVKAVLILADFPQGQDLTDDANDAMDPKEEHTFLAQGTWVDPKPYDNMTEHLMAHVPMLELLQQIAQGGGDPAMLPPEVKDVALFTEMLTEHLKATMDLIQTQAEMAGLMAPAGEQGAGAAPGAPGERGVLEGQGGPAGGGGGQQNTGTKTQEAGKPPMGQDSQPNTAQQANNRVREEAVKK